jgi:hypothetical protein
MKRLEHSSTTRQMFTKKSEICDSARNFQLFKSKEKKLFEAGKGSILSEKKQKIIRKAPFQKLLKNAEKFLIKKQCSSKARLGKSFSISEEINLKLN